MSEVPHWQSHPVGRWRPNSAGGVVWNDEIVFLRLHQSSLHTLSISEIDYQIKFGNHTSVWTQRLAKQVHNQLNTKWSYITIGGWCMNHPTTYYFMKKTGCGLLLLCCPRQCHVEKSGFEREWIVFPMERLIPEHMTCPNLGKERNKNYTKIIKNIWNIIQRNKYRTYHEISWRKCSCCT